MTAETPTAEDFANAEFARNPHSAGVGMRKDAGDPNTWCVAYEGPEWRIGIRTDAEMADGGWSPVLECPDPERHASQEPTEAAQIIDQHRQDGRSVGYGVTVHCVCGAESWGYVDGSRPIDDENNSHRVADRKHATHVADMLARAARRDEETR